MAELDVKKVLAHLVEDGGTVVVEVSGIDSLPVTVSHEKIKSEHVSVNEIFSNPSAQTADWKVVTANKSLTIDVDKASPTSADRTAAISGTTDLTLYLNPTDTKGKSGTVVAEVSSVVLGDTVTNSEVTSNHVVVKSILGNPSAQTADWKVETYDGSFKIDADVLNPTAADRAAALSGTTSATLYLTVESAGSQS